MARLDFGNGTYVADFVLPAASYDVSDIISEPDFASWTNEEMEISSLNVYIPRFSVNYTVQNLGDCLTMIDPRLNIYGKHISLFEEEVYNTTSIMQQIALEVNETGAKVASVTYNGELLANRPIEFKVDRPFVMMIRLRDTGAILAAARIGDPVETN